MDHNERILNKLDELDSRLDSINLTLERNTVSLEIHEKRTTASEKRIEIIEKHVLTVNAVVKVGLFLAGFSGFVLTLFEISAFIK